MKRNLNNPTEYSIKILESRWKEVLNGKPCSMFFSTEHNGRFRDLVEGFTRTITQPVAIVTHQLGEDSLLEPYFPFLPLVKDLITEQGISPETLLDAVPVYPPQKPVFQAYLSGSLPVRKDLLSRDEVPYETTQIWLSIFALLQYLSLRKPLIVVLSGIRNVQPSLLGFIRFIQERGADARIFCLYAFSRGYQPASEIQQERWDSFLTFIESTTTIFDIPAGTGETGDQDAPLEEPAAVAPEEMVRLARINLSFLCFAEALSCGNAAYTSISVLPGPHGEYLLYRLIHALGDAWYYSGEQNQALIQYQAITEKAQRTDNAQELALSYYKTGMSYFAMGDMEAARRFSLLYLKILDRLDDPLHRLYAYYFSFLISTSTSLAIEREMYFSLMRMLKEQHLDNMYAYCCGNVVLYSPYYDSMDEVIRICDESIAYYQANRNEFGLSFALHKKAIIYSNNAQFDEAFVFMIKSKKIREQINAPLHIVQIQNGLGYLYYLTGKYDKALSCFRKSLQILERLNNYDEVLITLYNIAMLYYIASYYDRCIAILDKMLKIMYVLKIRTLPFHNLEDIYALKALCCAASGSSIKAIELVHKVRSSTEILPWKTRFFIEFIQGITASLEGEMEDAVRFFDKGIEILRTGDESNQDFLPFFYLEYARAWMINGDPDRADILIDRGLEAAGPDREYARQKLTALRTSGADVVIHFELGDIQVNLDTLITLAQKEYILSRLQNKIQDIRFLNIIQTELMQLDNRAAVAGKLLKLVNYQFPMEISAFYLTSKRGPGERLALNLPQHLDPETTEALFRAAQAVPGKRLFSAPEIRQLLPDGDSRVRTLIAVPILENKTPTACIFLATERQDIFLTNEDLEILLITAGQIGILFEKIRHEEKIMRLSREDPLSGLYNRQALQHQLKLESERLWKNEPRTRNRISIAFIDLDNFKYYNDTFGHQLGDQLLAEFSDLLRKSFREVDFIARYGGDEFVILIPDTDPDTVRLPVNRLYDAIEKRQHFTPDIEKFLGHPVEIPENIRLSCSVGISSYTRDSGPDENLEKLMQQADHALYEAKKSGKKQLKFWEEISE